jgi:hypothetical protein
VCRWMNDGEALAGGTRAWMSQHRRAGWVRVAETFAWDLIAASSLLLGGLFVLGLPMRRHALGLVMAFSAGVLIP